MVCNYALFLGKMSEKSLIPSLGDESFNLNYQEYFFKKNKVSGIRNRLCQISFDGTAS